MLNLFNEPAPLSCAPAPGGGRGDAAPHRRGGRRPACGAGGHADELCDDRRARRCRHPTVYNHFPTPGALLVACAGHALAGAPPLGPEIFAGTADLESRLHALAHALCATYRYLAPWLRWSVHEAVLVRELAERLERMAESRRRLIAMALAPACGRKPPETLMAWCEILLAFPAWQRLA